MQGYEVNLADINKECIDSINKGIYPYFEHDFEKFNFNKRELNLSATDEKSCVKDSDIIVFAVPTLSKNSNDENIDAFIDMIKEYEDYYNKNQLFIIRSTLQIDAYNKILLYLSGLLGKEIMLVYCPERISESYAYTEIFELPQIIAANSEKAFEKTKAVFKNITSKLIKMTPKEAEMSKLMLNAWRYIEFSVANNFYMLCENEGLDFYKIFNAVKEDYPRASSYKKAGFVAGPCLEKDTLNLIKKFPNTFEIGKNAITVNKKFPIFILSKLIKKIGSIENKKILILGTSFKANCDDKRNSSAFALRDEIIKNNAIPLMCDIFSDDKKRHEHLIKSADAVILAAPHDKYKNIKLNGKVCIDCWNFWEK